MFATKYQKVSRIVLVDVQFLFYQFLSIFINFYGFYLAERCFQKQLLHRPWDGRFLLNKKDEDIGESTLHVEW